MYVITRMVFVPLVAMVTIDAGQMARAAVAAAVAAGVAATAVAG